MSAGQTCCCIASRPIARGRLLRHHRILLGAQAFGPFGLAGGEVRLPIAEICFRRQFTIFQIPRPGLLKFIAANEFK